MLKGLPRRRRDLAPRAAQRAAADDHRDRDPGRLPDRRPGGGRDAVPLPRHRPADLNAATQQGLPDARGRRARRSASSTWSRRCSPTSSTRCSTRASATGARRVSTDRSPAESRRRAVAGRARGAARGASCCAAAAALEDVHRSALSSCCFWVVCAIFGTRSPRTTRSAPNLARRSTRRRQRAHWFGTDQLGRDMFSRVIVGARDILTIAPLATLSARSLGTALGLSWAISAASSTSPRAASSRRSWRCRWSIVGSAGAGRARARRPSR